MPCVSVVIPTYNRADLVCEALESVAAQTYKDWEIILVDDGSTDNTREAVAPYLTQLGSRLRYIKQENRGLAAARNTGIWAARGSYIALLDSDDVWKPEKLATQVPYLEADASVGLVSSRAEQVDAANKQVLGLKPKDPAGTTLATMIVQGTQPPSSFLIRKTAIESIGGFDPAIKRGIEDVDLCFRLARRWKFVCLEQPLIRYRLHSTNLSSEPLGTYLGYVQTYEKLLIDPDATVPVAAARRYLAKYLYLLGASYRRSGKPTEARQCLARAIVLWPFVGWMLDGWRPWWYRLGNLVKSYGVVLASLLSLSGRKP